jgi:DNA repair protein RadA/Sms
MKTKEVYRCTECGARSGRWQGQCPGCGEWNTLAAVTERSAKKSGSAPAPALRASKPQPLSECSTENFDARPTGLEGLDPVLGGGLVPGAAILLGGEPGVGKSTLLLQLAGTRANDGDEVVYGSGEESLPQLKNRAERISRLSPTLKAVATSNADELLDALEGPNPPDLIIADSVQTLASPRAEGLPGSVSQVRAVSTELIERAKAKGTALILVGHVTKDGQIAGPKLLEHMVDTVLYLEGDRRTRSRILRVLKNRFGPSDELVVMDMHETGLTPVGDPSTHFLGKRDTSLPGTALALAVDGHRPFALEVQALSTETHLSNPRRTALGLDGNRLHLLLAVMQKRLNLNLGQYDIYAKLAGGLVTRDPGLDLAVAAAILSTFYDQPLPEGAIFWGEVDLNGQIRSAPGHDTRKAQAKRLGFSPAVHSAKCRTLGDLQRFLFGRRG